MNRWQRCLTFERQQAAANKIRAFALSCGEDEAAEFSFEPVAQGGRCASWGNRTQAAQRRRQSVVGLIISHSLALQPGFQTLTWLDVAARKLFPVDILRTTAASG